MAAPGAITELRVSGLPGGYPTDLGDAASGYNVRIRFVDDMLVQLADREADFLKYIGGVNTFTFNNPKVEWVEDDLWTRRLVHAGLGSASATALTVYEYGTTGGGAHRYPIGTLIVDPATGEVMRVTAHASTTQLTVVRDIAGDATEAAVASTAELIVAGLATSEGEDWKFRPAAIFRVPYNYAQVSSVGAKASYRRQFQGIYGLRGTDLDKITADTVAEQLVAAEGMALYGRRFVGSATTNPAMAGGIRYYVTAANGAEISDIGSSALTEKDIMDDLQSLYYAVGPSNMAKTLVTSMWGWRKLSSFYASSQRMKPGVQAGGIVIDQLITEFGPIDILVHRSIAMVDMLLLKRENIKVGSFAGLGRPHVIQLPVSSGPYVARAFYSDLSVMIKGVHAMGRIHSFSTST